MNDLWVCFFDMKKVRKAVESVSKGRVKVVSVLFLIMMVMAISCSDSGTGNSPEDSADTPPVITTLELSTDAIFIGIEDIRQPDVRVLDENGQPVQGVSVKWRSEDSSVAEVSAGGVITGKKSGSTTIRAEVENLSKSVRVEVFQGTGYSSAELEAVDRAVTNYLQQEGIPEPQWQL